MGWVPNAGNSVIVLPQPVGDYCGVLHCSEIDLFTRVAHRSF